mgnify:CR=1 FL=1
MSGRGAAASAAGVVEMVASKFGYDSMDGSESDMKTADGLIIMFWEGAKAEEDAARMAKAKDRDFIMM